MHNKKSIKPVFLIILIIISAIIILSFVFLIYISQTDLTPDFSDYPVLNPNQVIKIIDGDTFQTANNEIIRLLCINAPEKGEEGYEESKLFLENLIFGKEVILEKDITDKDKYNRLLRYVYIQNVYSDNKDNSNTNLLFINREIYQNNHAEIYRFPPDTSKCDEIEG